jgi:hypothetical protein
MIRYLQGYLVLIPIYMSIDNLPVLFPALSSGRIHPKKKTGTRVLLTIAGKRGARTIPQQ